MTGTSKYSEGFYHLAEQWPYLRFLGMGAWWAWIWLCYSGTGLFVFHPEGEYVRQVGSMYLFSTPAIMAAMVAAALGWRKVSQLLGRRSVSVGLSALATAGTLLIALSPYVGGPVAFGIGGILTGLGTSILALKTGQEYGTLGRHEVLTAGAVSLMLAAFLYFMGTGLASEWRPFFIALLPLVGALLYVIPHEDSFPAQELPARSLGKMVPGKKSYMRLVLAASIVAATAGFARGLATVSMGGVDYARVGASITFLIFVLAIVMAVMVNVGDIVQSVRRVYAGLIMLGVIVVLVSAFGGNLLYTGVGKELLWMLFTCLMAYMSFRFDFPAVQAFGLGQAAYFAASAGSWALGIACAPYLDMPSARFVVPAAMVLVIVMVYVFVFNDADIKFIFTWKWGQENGSAEPAAAGEKGDELTPSSPSDPAWLTRHISAIPESYGISAREAEVMLFFAQGQSANWIAEELVISKNTVRSHIRSIYTKLDVHSREELLGMLAKM